MSKSRRLQKRKRMKIKPININFSSCQCITFYRRKRWFWRLSVRTAADGVRVPFVQRLSSWGHALASGGWHWTEPVWWRLVRDVPTHVRVWGQLCRQGASEGCWSKSDSLCHLQLRHKPYFYLFTFKYSVADLQCCVSFNLIYILYKP